MESKNDFSHFSSKYPNFGIILENKEVIMGHIWKIISNLRLSNHANI